MPRTSAALLTVWLLPGCTNGATDHPESTSVVVVPQLEAELQDRSVEQDQGSAVPRQSTPGDRIEPADTASSTPVDEAADEILRLLEGEDLFVLDLQTDTATADDTTAAVQVRVLYGTGRGHPTDATYRVDLDLANRAWTVTSVKATS